MAYKKKQPKIMSDGNIAHVNMIVKTTRGLARIIITRDSFPCSNGTTSDHGIIIKPNYPLAGYELYDRTGFEWVSPGMLNKATPEEKKQYWKEQLN